VNGHSFRELSAAVDAALCAKDAPVVIIADTSRAAAWIL
jgi:transketolase N-terminal domain/subunit